VVSELKLAHALQPLLTAAFGGPVAIDGLAPFGDGHSGFTYRVAVRIGGVLSHRILRVSPPGARIAGPSDMGLQGRIMQAVSRYGVPVPLVLASSSEPVLNGRSFVLMEQVDGQSWEEQLDLDALGVVEATVGVLERLRHVPLGESGLDLARGRDARAEVEHWAGLLARCDEGVRRPLEAAFKVLRSSAPPTEAMHLVHGDFHFGNLLFRGGEVAAVLDWEIASIGDQLFDVAGLVVAAMRARYAPEPNPTGSVKVGLSDIARIAGVEETTLQWYVAASCFKYAAILGYNHGLHRSGKRVDPIYDQLERTMCGLADEAAQLAA
jgi:aminoglycoside phosphotransferase (APT) family kinase protein